ncbi:MAG: hypothetical protein WC417_07400 [Candidatus Omnitrophota bacterium]|jgi:xanthine dehydrogenase molybdopterin-binding subunit B
MIKKSWNLNELRDMFVAKYGNNLLPRLEEYLYTIHWKKWRTEFHIEQSDHIWAELFKLPVVSASDEPFQKALESAQAEAEATVQTLHAIGDILAQAVNLTIFGPVALSEDNVSLHNVLKKIREQGAAPKVEQALISFKSSNEFKYVDAFCNTVKHRKLIDVFYHFHADIKNDTLQEGIKFKEFSYKGDSFPAIWFDSVSKEFKLTIYDLLCDVGLAINEFLK